MFSAAETLEHSADTEAAPTFVQDFNSIKLFATCHSTLDLNPPQ